MKITAFAMEYCTSNFRMWGASELLKALVWLLYSTREYVWQY